MPKMVAALFVAEGGVYFNLPSIEPWGVSRDARLYTGPHPVVAHPPCERWGRYWSGGPSAKVRCKLGDDGGCFKAALAAVRRWGGVLEHPEGSHAWRAFGIPTPPRSGGWISTGGDGGWTCCVEQGHYGHLARKATWLYEIRVNPEECRMRWGPATNCVRLDEGFHSKEERAAARIAGARPRARLSKTQCVATPIEFRDLLIRMARSVTDG